MGLGRGATRVEERLDAWFVCDGEESFRCILGISLLILVPTY